MSNTLKINKTKMIINSTKTEFMGGKKVAEEFGKRKATDKQ